MHIAILSDTHDRLDHLGRALERARDCGALLFCGDFCAPFTLREMAGRFPGPIHAILGNNAGDVLLLSQVAGQAGNVTLYGDHAEMELAGRRIAIVHYPRLAEGLAALGVYDLVCYGHNHKANVERRGKTLLVNPGEVMGMYGRPTCAIYDSEAGQAEILDL